MTATRSLFLVRHGETTGESSVRYHGRNDVPLSELGRAQIQGQVGFLAPRHFAALIHSPLSRAREAAEILRAGLLRPPDVVEEAPDLTEVHFGAMEGLTEAEIAAELPDFFRRWKAGDADGYPEGETFAGFRARIAGAFDGLLARHPAGDLLVVCHKGVIKIGMQRLLGLSQEATARLHPDLGSIAVLSLGPEPRLKHFNLLPDLP